MSSLRAAMYRRPRRTMKRADSGITLTTAFGGMFAELGDTDSGQVVTQAKALGLPAVGNAIRLISRSIGTLPLVTYEGTDEDRRPIPSDPTYRLLALKPNPAMTASVCWTTLFRHLAGWGNAFLGTETVALSSGRREVVALWPIEPERVTIEIRDGRKIFHVVTDTGIKRYTNADIIHVMLDSDDGFRGLSPIAQHRQAIGQQLALAQYGSKAIGRRGIPPGIFRVKGKITDPQVKSRMRAEWKRIHGGSSQAHEIAILDEDADFKPIVVPLVDAQFIEQRKYGIAEVAQIFTMPAAKLQGSTGDSLTYSTRESNQLEFLTDGLRPYMKAAEDAFNGDVDLCPPDRRKSTAFQPDELLRVDAMTRAKVNALSTGGAPWRKPSEVRPGDNLPYDEGFDYVPTKPLPVDPTKEDQPNAADSKR